MSNNLTHREKESLRLISEGFEISELAIELRVSKSTIQQHLSSARTKLGVRNTMQAVVKYMRTECETDTSSPGPGSLAGLFAVPQNGSKFSLRELDCLRMAVEGHSSVEAAGSIGIRTREFDSYLTSALKKLDAIAFAKASHSLELAAPANASQLPYENDLTYESGWSLGMIWRRFCESVRSQGFKQVNLGIVAEPPGSFTNGAKLVRTTLPAAFLDLYEGVGGSASDALAHYTSQSNQPLYITEEYGSFRFAKSSAQMREFSEYWYDSFMRPYLSRARLRLLFRSFA